MDIGKRIKDRRKELGLNAETVAEKIGVSPATIYRYESADILNMGIDKVELIAEALYTTPAYLMGWTDEQPLTEKEQKLFTSFKALNETGKTKAVEYVSDLADNPKYQKADRVCEPAVPYVPSVLAAHHETGLPDDEDMERINAAIDLVGKLKREKGEL